MKLKAMYVRVRPLLIGFALVAAMLATAAGTKWY